MSDADDKQQPGEAQPLKVADARTHTSVRIDHPEGGQQIRYLYKDAHGWYVLNWPDNTNVQRHYLVEADGAFTGVFLA